MSASDDGYDMAVRHQVQNLQRRENIFYWRTRLPAQLGRNIGSRHLAFSLKQSDHRPAGYFINYTEEWLEAKPVEPQSIVSVADVGMTPDIIQQPQPIIAEPIPVTAQPVTGLPVQDLAVKQCDFLSC